MAEVAAPTPGGLQAAQQLLCMALTSKTGELIGLVQSNAPVK